MYAPFIEEQRERYFNWLEMNLERNINRTNNDIEEPRRQRRRREQDGEKNIKNVWGKRMVSMVVENVVIKNIQDVHIKNVLRSV